MPLGRPSIETKRVLCTSIIGLVMSFVLFVEFPFLADNLRALPRYSKFIVYISCHAHVLARHCSFITRDKAPPTQISQSFLNGSSPRNMVHGPRSLTLDDWRAVRNINGLRWRVYILVPLGTICSIRSNWYAPEKSISAPTTTTAQFMLSRMLAPSTGSYRGDLPTKQMIDDLLC